MQLRDRTDTRPASVTGPSRWTKQRLEDVLGQPLMVADPLVTATQAATLLGVRVMIVDRLVAAGTLTARGARSYRRFLVSDLSKIGVAELQRTKPLPRKKARAKVGAGDWITITAAARIVGVGVQTLRRRYLGTPDLPRLYNTQRVIRRDDAEDLARRVADRVTARVAADMLGWTITGVQELMRDGVLSRYHSPRPVRRDQVEQLVASGWQPPVDPIQQGRISAHMAAEILGCHFDVVRRRARQGRIPAVRDSRRQWWFRPEHVDMIRRARLSEELGKPLPHDRPGGGLLTKGRLAAGSVYEV